MALTQRRLLPRPEYDSFGRVTNFHYDENNRLVLGRDPHPRRAFWNYGEPIGPPHRYFKQLEYQPLDGTKPKLLLAMEGAILDCGQDIQQVFNQLGPSLKVWMIVKVHYEPVNPEDENHKGFDAYLRTRNTMISKLDGTINGWENPYEVTFRLLSDRVLQHNANFIKEKSGLQLSNIYQLILKFATFQPLEGGAWKQLPKYLAKKQAVINIKNKDERCFGYALLYFMDPPKVSNRYSSRPTLYTPEMFLRNNLHELPYPISPRDVHLYENKLQINISIVSFSDDEGRKLFPMYSSKTYYSREADLLYWNEHYAPIVNLSKLLYGVTKGKYRKYFCNRCWYYAKTKRLLELHKKLCTRQDFISTLHLLPAPDSEESFLEFKEFRKTSNAPFVIYADFESILESIDSQNKRTHYVQHHKVCAAAAILCSYIAEMDNQVMMFCGPDALADFLNQLIKWETKCIEYLQQNIPMKPLSRKEQIEYNGATSCYLCRQLFQENDPKGYKVRDHDHITGNFIGAAHRQCNIERPVNYLIPVFFHNFRGYDGHLIVHQFRFHRDRQIKVIGQNMENYLQIQ